MATPEVLSDLGFVRSHGNFLLCRLAVGELWGLSRVKITPAACFPLPAGSLPGFSTTSPGSSLASSAFVFGPGRGGGGGGGEHLAQLLVCQESNITRGLARFQVFPGAFRCSIVKFLARISWLWERLSACLSLLGLCFICSRLALTG